MSTDLSTAVATWLSRWASGELTTEGFAQIDLDELLDDPPADGARTALRCLQLAVSEVRTTTPDVDGILTIPLPMAVSLVQESPTLEDVFASPWEYGPGLAVPGLYLVRPSIWRLYEPVEEYRRHLYADELLPPGYVAYYRVWRSESERSKGWEYDRTIYVRTADER